MLRVVCADDGVPFEEVRRMDAEVMVVFLAAALVSVLTPGPAVALALRNGSRYGLRAALWSSAGNVSGLLLLSIAAMLGIHALLMSSALAFAIAKGLGAAYLIWLGVRQFRSGGFALPTESVALEMPRRRALMQQGFLVALTNPKAILFISALFPQFLDPARPPLPQFAVLTLSFMAMSFLALAGYGAAAAHARRWLARPALSRWVGRVFGSVFVGLGVAMAALRRPVL